MDFTFLFGSRDPRPELPSPFERKCQFCYTPCLMMGEVSLETSPKNIMIQDMINSENSRKITGSANTNIFKTKVLVINVESLRFRTRT